MAPPIGPQPRVGVAVFVLNSSGQFLLGKRKGSHGAGTWAHPGGHLEFNETFEDCAVRETLEETGLVCQDVRYLTATNNVMREEGVHYVTIWVTAKVEGKGIMPQLMEPEKCEGWEWVTWEDVKGWGKLQREAKGETVERTLFSPFLDLFMHRPDLDPVQNAL